MCHIRVPRAAPAAMMGVARAVPQVWVQASATLPQGEAAPEKSSGEEIGHVGVALGDGTTGGGDGEGGRGESAAGGGGLGEEQDPSASMTAPGTPADMMAGAYAVMHVEMVVMSVGAT